MKIIIGTRKSELALWQTSYIAGLLKNKFPFLEIEIKKIVTTGDKIQKEVLSKIGDKGLFTKEIEQALLNNEIDLAVHSLKDLPTSLPEGLVFAGSPGRANPADAFLSYKYKSLEELPRGIVMATGSLRRKAQFSEFARKTERTIDFKELRGNIHTRLQKLKDFDYDGIVMAAAALERLEIKDEALNTVILPMDFFVPAVSQGAIGLEIRKNDKPTAKYLEAITDKKTMLICSAERSFMAKLEGGCSVPLGAYGDYNENTGMLRLSGFLASPDAGKVIREKIHTHFTKDKKDFEAGLDVAQKAGLALAEFFLQKGAGDILESL